MKSFKEYLLEIFNRKESDSEDHPDFLKRETPDENTFVYSHVPKDSKGNPIKEKEIRTWMLKREGGDWEVTFIVGGIVDTRKAKEFPSDVSERVFGHLRHFVDTTKKRSGNAPHIKYETVNKKKQRIYQAVVKRLGATAKNIQTLE